MLRAGRAELIHRRAPWKTVEAVELATPEWVTWFNHQRLLGPIGYIPPAEAAERYYSQLAAQVEYACTLTTGPLQNLGRFSQTNIA